MSIDINKLSEQTKTSDTESTPANYETSIQKMLNQDYNPQERNLNEFITERYEMTATNPEGRIKKVEYRDDEDRLIIVREYHRNGRYQRTVYTPDGIVFVSELYNANGEKGKPAGQRKRKLKDKKMIGFYTTEELNNTISNFDANHKNISKSDFINFCLHYTLDSMSEEELVKHIEVFQEYLEKQGY